MVENNIRVRFAPSPTGALHIGGARTALFNFLYARHTGGKFLLRIEDTDKERSTQSSAEGIIKGLRWLEIEPEEPIVYQSDNLARHQEVAKHLIEIGAAYHCYTSPEELQQDRGHGFKFKSKWRDEVNIAPPAGIKPVVRFKMPRESATVLTDLIQSNVTVENTQLDDMVLLRSDGTPTFILAAVVDDHDMRISHVIRGDEHFNNAFRQYHLFKAMGWNVPVFAHIPLIHAKDGTKLSKRHGAVGLSEYEEQGYLPEAINNYLLRLGFGHGNDEIISRTQAIEWFDINDVKKSPARLDFDKLLHLNAHYLRGKADAELVELCREKFLEASTLSTEQLRLLAKGIGGVKLRARTLNELFAQAKFYVASEPITISNEALAFVKNFDQNLLSRLCDELRLVHDWSETALKAAIKKFMEETGLNMQIVAHVVRALTTGSTNSPGIFEVMRVLGKEKTLIRLAR